MNTSHGAPGGRLPCRFLSFLILLSAGLTRGADFNPATAVNSPIPLTLNVGFVRSCFLNVNQADAESAFKTLAATVGRQRGYRVTSNTRLFETTADIHSAVKSGEVNLAILDSWKYLEISHDGFATPSFVTSENGRVGKKYLILTRRESGLNTLTNLRGQSFVVLEVANSNAGRTWLDTLLLENQLGSQSNFFGTITSASKPSLAVLPVFFGKERACLVDNFSFDLLTELNPQLGRELQTLTTSETYVDTVLCVATNGWATPKAREDIIDILAHLHEQPAGQQILMLFKVSQLVPFKEEQLQTVRALRDKRERLENEKRTPAEIGANTRSPASYAP